jgi:hypothetical protein
MHSPLQVLGPDAEIAYMRDTLGLREPAILLDRVISYFTVLQARSAMLLSLISLCLTISGFSGHRIALGMGLSVVSAIFLLTGPLQLRWATRRCSPDGFDATLRELLLLRDLRTRRYHLSVLLLVLGLSAYIGAVILSILPAGVPA